MQRVSHATIINNSEETKDPPLAQPKRRIHHHGTSASALIDTVQNPYKEKRISPLWRLLGVICLLGIPTACLLMLSSQRHQNRATTTSLTNHESLEAFDNTVKNWMVLMSKRSLSNFQNYQDPNLHTMTFRLEDEEFSQDDDQVVEKMRTFDAYVTPDVSTFYQEAPGSRQKMKPQFVGFGMKFINLSPKTVGLYWDDNKGGMLLAEVGPFQAIGTSTFAVHKFFCKDMKAKDPNEVLQNIPMHYGQNVYVYDAFSLEHANRKDLNKEEMELYKLQYENLEFGKLYKNFTGREWLALYPSKPKPIYPMWNADYFGQEHWVATDQVHYIEEPPASLLKTITERELRRRHDGTSASDLDVSLASYRSKETHLNLTLKVLSCSPRVFEIQNFLSHAEVDHIVHMATGIKLKVSSTSAGGSGSNRHSDAKTRTSKNSWLDRNRSPIIDTIYARAASLMQFDEALLRTRDYTEEQRFKEAGLTHRQSNGEYLQLVHYEVGQQYTPHHDFTYPHTSTVGQPERFSTLILYLNEGMRGGETSFPRFQNGHTADKLAVTPETGKAVLFYDVLPDGNMDEFSQHAAERVKEGEKWMINLWTWDPKRGY
mmetsp:Transcript_14150/g.20899  ORF Transcript_14150/g.20899 Transcript_14150/m.20899 type:complete len:599 (-) Transcript_14150:148-1944(-)